MLSAWGLLAGGEPVCPKQVLNVCYIGMGVEEFHATCSMLHTQSEGSLQFVESRGTFWYNGVPGPVVNYVPPAAPCLSLPPCETELAPVLGDSSRPGRHLEVGV